MRQILSSLREVFRQPFYVVTAAIVSFILLAVNAWLPSRDLIGYFFSSDYFNWGDRLALLGRLLMSMGVNLTILRKVFIILIAILAGINLSLLIYFLKRRLHFYRETGASLAGILLSLFGIGCASCGSVLLSSVLGLSVTSLFISWLPFKGIELGLLSLIILIWSIYSLSKRLQKNLACTWPARG